MKFTGRGQVQISAKWLQFIGTAAHDSDLLVSVSALLVSHLLATRDRPARRLSDLRNAAGSSGAANAKAHEIDALWAARSDVGRRAKKS